MSPEDRYLWLRTRTKPSPARQALQRRWDRAVIMERWELADAIFEHLWPGVLP